MCYYCVLCLLCVLCVVCVRCVPTKVCLSNESRDWAAEALRPASSTHLQITCVCN